MRKQHLVIDAESSKKIFRLSEDEKNWEETGAIDRVRYETAVASLNGKIYVCGGKLCELLKKKS